MALKRIVLPPQSAPAGTLVLLHGYGADERDLLPLGHELNPGYRVVSLQAPLAMGFGGRAWFGIEDTPDGFQFDPDEIAAALSQTISSVEEVAADDSGKPPMLLGFSQGACMAMMAALKRPTLVRGVVSLSGVPPQIAASERAPLEALKGMPVFGAHGTQDQLLPIGLGRGTQLALEAAGCALTWKEYPMGHQVSLEEIADVRAWLAQVPAWPR